VHCYALVAVWHSGSGIGHSNVAAQRQAWLVLGWMTLAGVQIPAIEINFRLNSYQG